MSPPEQTKPSPPSGEDDIIELTEVVEQPADEVPEDANAEVVLDFRGGDDLESLKSQVKPSEAEPEAPPTVPREESLDDFLVTLPDLPDDLDVSPEPPPPPSQTTPDPRQELAERLSDDELKELVRRVVQEKVERLVEEMFPKMAAEAIDRELTRWKKRLTD